jgi:hypothetical protein
MILSGGAALHAVALVPCLMFRTRGSRPLGPKPARFALSIALFLGSLAWVLPRVSVASSMQDALAIVFVLTMAIEMALIVFQAARGTRSHFNSATRFDGAVWSTMVLAIVVASMALVVLVFGAWSSSFLAPDGAPYAPSMTWAVRMGVALLLFAPLSGFTMGGRLAHAVGGSDEGPGLPVTGFHLRYGDLRLSHFVSLHALQVLPAAAWLAHAMGLSEGACQATTASMATALGAFTSFAYVRALRGRGVTPKVPTSPEAARPPSRLPER